MAATPVGRKASATIENGVGDIRLKSEEKELGANLRIKRETSPFGGGSGTNTPSFNNFSRSPSKMQSRGSPAIKADSTQTVGGDIMIKQEPGKSLKITRTGSHKVEKRPPMLFSHYDDATEEATSTFELLSDCTYANKSMGFTDPALECDCSEEWSMHESNHGEN